MRLPGPRLNAGVCHGTFTKLFGDLLLFVYHCFDRLSFTATSVGCHGEQVVHFFEGRWHSCAQQEILSSERPDQTGSRPSPAIIISDRVGRKGVRKEDYVLPWLRRMTKRNAYGVYFIFKSMEQGPTFRGQRAEVSTRIKPPHPARQRSRFQHRLLYIAMKLRAAV